MKLRFLGQPYSHSQAHLETIPSDYTACYRGQKYHLRVPATSLATPSDCVASRRHRSELSVSIRKYRGVSYIVENQKFPPSKSREFCH